MKAGKFQVVLGAKCHAYILFREVKDCGWQTSAETEDFIESINYDGFTVSGEYVHDLIPIKNSVVDFMSAWTERCETEAKTLDRVYIVPEVYNDYTNWCIENKFYRFDYITFCYHVVQAFKISPGSAGFVYMDQDANHKWFVRNDFKREYRLLHDYIKWELA